MGWGGNECFLDRVRIIWVPEMKEFTQEEIVLCVMGRVYQERREKAS